MSQALKISLIIPVYNEEKYLTACLDSVAAQHSRPYEVIVVDNNCTDGSMLIARRYAFVRLLAETRQGRVFAQGNGFAAAGGDILARIDADSILPADWTDTVSRNLCQTDAVTGRGRFYDLPLPLRGPISKLQVGLYQYFQKLLTGSYFLWGSNMAVRRDAWQAVSAELAPDPTLDEDILLTLLLKRHGYRVAYTPDLIVQASFRRGRLNVSEAYRYLSSWPRDYWRAGLYGRAVIIALLSALIIIGTLPITLALELKYRLEAKTQ